jgi:hypothetical protein
MRKSLCEWYGMACDNNGKSKNGVSIESEVMLLISELPVPIPGLASVHWSINDNIPLKCSFPSLRHPLTSTFPLWNLFSCLSVSSPPSNAAPAASSNVCEYYRLIMY